jgi:hypothetical protein
MMQRVDPAATSADAKEFWVTTTVLAGLRFPWESIKHWFQRVTNMQESSDYQGLILEERAEEARRILLLRGEGSFGVPDQATRTELESMNNVEQLDGWPIGFLTSRAGPNCLPRREATPRN